MGGFTPREGQKCVPCFASSIISNILLTCSKDLLSIVEHLHRQTKASAYNSETRKRWLVNSVGKVYWTVGLIMAILTQGSLGPLSGQPPTCTQWTLWASPLRFLRHHLSSWVVEHVRQTSERVSFHCKKWVKAQMARTLHGPQCHLGCTSLSSVQEVAPMKAWRVLLVALPSLSPDVFLAREMFGRYLLLLVFYFVASDSLNTRPIIGILTKPTMTGLMAYGKSYIAASYVKVYLSLHH